MLCLQREDAGCFVLRWHCLPSLLLRLELIHFQFLLTLLILKEFPQQSSRNMHTGAHECTCTHTSYTPYTCMLTNILEHLHTYACTPTSIYAHTCTQQYMHTITYICIHTIHTHTYKHTHTNAHTYTCTHVHIINAYWYIHTLTHTYTHIPAHNKTFAYRPLEIWNT